MVVPCSWEAFVGVVTPGPGLIMPSMWGRDVGGKGRQRDDSRGLEACGGGSS